ncbi:MAG TPA: RNA polymerase recycling motor HelD [Clostridiaceae bacterium]
MPAIKHPAYKEEAIKLANTTDYLKVYNQKVIDEKYNIDRAVDYSVSHFNSDNAEQFNELLINTNLQYSLEGRLKNLLKSIDKPYFARVDFIENGETSFKKLYIGKISLMRDKDQELIIIDWRAPIATLYYEGRLGSASFNCPEGIIEGEIKLKRQYSIEKGCLQDIFDIDITTNDEFLQAALGSNKDKRLKDIVTTIQAEQNKVIRSDMWKSLVVQGSAGGGKTTIALHRIAYLLYNQEKTLSSKNFMIIAPNKFFLSYISEVLPDLGVEDVIQTTFQELSLNFIGCKLEIRSPWEKLSYLTSVTPTGLKERIKWISSFKSSLEYKNVIKEYLKNLEYDFIPKEDFKIIDFILVKYETINNLFIEDYKDFSFERRISEIKKTLVNTLKQRKVPILEEIETSYDQKLWDIKEAMPDSQERRDIIINLIDERDSSMEKVKRLSKTLVKSYISKLKMKSSLDYYKDLLSNKVLFLKLSGKYISEEISTVLLQDTLKNIKEGYLEVEDLAPLMYLQHSIFEPEEKSDIRHVIIDEAQDFSSFQLYIIKKVIGGTFTILGDLCQGIYSYRGVENWHSFSDEIFGKDNYNFMTLEQSYRTTVEIMDLANSVIKKLEDPNLPPAIPVIRHGDKIAINELKDLKEVAININIDLANIKKDSFKSAAIICKTIEECKSLRALLKSLGHDIKLLTEKDLEYTGGLVLLPAYLAKGLEFDVVILANCNKNNFTKEPLDMKLLYVSMTRPLHKLIIYSVGEKSEALSY